ncbi:MAG: hypothetical protein ACFFAY_12680 [Promethearchaeota archaeon]
MTDLAWVPCVLEDVSIDTRFFMGGPYYTSPSDTDFEALFLLPMPTMKDGRRLHISGLKIGVYDGNPADYVSRAIVYAASFDKYQGLLDDSTPRNAKGSYTYPIATTDVSTFEKVVVRLWCVASQPKGLDISSILVQCQYI